MLKNIFNNKLICVSPLCRILIFQKLSCRFVIAISVFVLPKKKKQCKNYFQTRSELERKKKCYLISAQICKDHGEISTIMDFPFKV